MAENHAMNLNRNKRRLVTIRYLHTDEEDSFSFMFSGRSEASLLLRSCERTSLAG